MKKLLKIIVKNLICYTELKNEIKKAPTEEDICEKIYNIYYTN